jgi:hypothetical protein
MKIDDTYALEFESLKKHIIKKYHINPHSFKGQFSHES